MNAKADYFARYEAIAAISGQMLLAARGALWSDLAGLQREYRQLVDALRESEGEIRLNEEERARKYELIRRILADDAAIRDLANPRMSRLSALFAGPMPVRVMRDRYGAR
ncbi:flagellar protein FliT [Burkholderia sp. WAC0059]|uniref:flagellar protein FliT n=1 Tax=Burkholderia sp. WAC0059 TaxID=2066022 RepID=UPI000C7F4717|nr:flagellar protein FliT [Burkholderia sp. WAC0059]PLZ00683.1 flagellar protein FliT [Burkholderia sp. WAC0059]